MASKDQPNIKRIGVSRDQMNHALQTMDYMVKTDGIVARLYMLDVVALRISALARNCIERQITGTWDDIKDVDLVLSMFFSASTDAARKEPGTPESIHSDVLSLVAPLLDIIKDAAVEAQAAEQKKEQEDVDKPSTDGPGPGPIITP